LPKREFSEEDQQVAMKRDESTSSSLFTFYSQFPTICRDDRYIFVTAEHSASDRMPGGRHDRQVNSPAVVRLGTIAGDHTVFRIFYPQGFANTDFSIDLDKTYSQGSPELVAASASEYRFTVPNTVVSRFQNMVVRIGKAEPYLPPIPLEDRAPPKAIVNPDDIPVGMGKRGPVEWKGTALDSITDVVVLQPSTPDASPAKQVQQQFVAYANGTRLLVYLSPGITDTQGKVTVECTTSSGDKLNLPLFVSGT
jgi:hypothetical protein